MPEWRPIPGFDGYEVSDTGEVRSVSRVLSLRDGNVQRRRGKVLRSNVGSGGYLFTHIGSEAGGTAQTVRVHRLVALAFLPNPNNLPEINHKNGIKTDNCLANLEWCDKSHNGRHAAQIGLNPNASLTPDEVREIRAASRTGVPQSVIAARFKRSKKAVREVIHGRSYSWVTA